MSTHNIGFYEDLTKIIFELSSNIIKYAPYFFCCVMVSFINCHPLKCAVSIHYLMHTQSMRFYGELMKIFTELLPKTLFMKYTGKPNDIKALFIKF